MNILQTAGRKEGFQSAHHDLCKNTFFNLYKYKKYEEGERGRVSIIPPWSVYKLQHHPLILILIPSRVMLLLKIVTFPEDYDDHHQLQSIRVIFVSFLSLVDSLRRLTWSRGTDTSMIISKAANLQTIRNLSTSKENCPKWTLKWKGKCKNKSTEKHFKKWKCCLANATLWFRATS